MIRLQDVGRVEREDWAKTRVGDILEEGTGGAVRSDTPVLDALEAMREQKASRVMVVDNGKLRGILTMRDLMNYLSVHQELGVKPDPGAADAGRAGHRAA